MMTSNNYTSSPTTRKEALPHTKSSGSSSQVAGSASYLAGEDPSRLEQDKRSIYK